AAENTMMPDRCQTPEVPILQTSKCPLPPTPQRLRSRHITGKRTVKSGKNVADPGMKLVTSRRSTDPMIYRARLMPRLEISPSGRTPGVSFFCTKGGRVEQDRFCTRKSQKSGSVANMSNTKPTSHLSCG